MTRTRMAGPARLAVAAVSALLLTGACSASEPTDSVGSEPFSPTADVEGTTTSAGDSPATTSTTARDPIREQQELRDSLIEGRTEPTDPLPDVRKVQVGSSITVNGVGLQVHRYMSFDSCPWDRLASPRPGWTRLAVEISLNNHSGSGLVDAGLSWEMANPEGEAFHVPRRTCLDGPQGTTLFRGDAVRGWLEFELPDDESSLDLIWRGGHGGEPVVVTLMQ